MQIFISGSLAYDRIMDFPGKFVDHILPDKVHLLNVCFMVDGLTEKFGGTAGNIAHTLALLDEKPLILAACGRDFDRYRVRLQELGLSLAGVRCVEDELTAGAYITTDKTDNQITAFNPGAMKYPSKYEFDGLDPRQALAIVSPGSLEDMAVYPEFFRKKGAPFIFDPGQSIPALGGEGLRNGIRGSEILISNDYELEMITQASGWDQSTILENTKAIVTTLGEHGSLVLTRQGKIDIPAAAPTRVLDPTGAGDAYRAGMIKGLALGLDLPAACRVGAVSAVYAVENYGTQEHRFTPAEFRARYGDNFGEDLAW
ncbi:MAG: carbohydrate kinase family protein [Pseudomonadota bacterium]